MGRPAHAGAASTVALLYVRLGPKATELLRYRELPLCATSGLMQCSKRIHLARIIHGGGDFLEVSGD